MRCDWAGFGATSPPFPLPSIFFYMIWNNRGNLSEKLLAAKHERCHPEARRKAESDLAKAEARQK